MKDFVDKVAVVTGAASGIGRALAERFAAEGMKVVLADVDGERLARAEAEFAARGAAVRAVRAVRADVSRAAEVETLARETLRAFGAVHLVCNNAGLASRPVPSWENSSRRVSSMRSASAPAKSRSAPTWRRRKSPAEEAGRREK